MAVFPDDSDASAFRFAGLPVQIVEPAIWQKNHLAVWELNHTRHTDVLMPRKVFA